VLPSSGDERPKKLKKRGKPARSHRHSTPQPALDVGSSSSLLLSEHLHLARGVQIACTPEEEIIYAAALVDDLVSTMVEMMSITLVVGRTLGNELERNSAVVLAKLKAELNESSNSLKVTLEAMGSLKEQSRRVKTELDSVMSRNATIKAKLKASEQGRTDAIKVQEEELAKRETLAGEMAYYQLFLFRVDKDGFNEGVLG